MPRGVELAVDHYQLKQRPAPRARRATCEEVDCVWFRDGFGTRVDESTPDGARLGARLRLDPTRPAPQEWREGAHTVFAWPAGTPCLSADQHVIETMQLYLVKPHRRGVRGHVRAEDWVDEFGTNQQNLAEIRARG